MLVFQLSLLALSFILSATQAAPQQPASTSWIYISATKRKLPRCSKSSAASATPYSGQNLTPVRITTNVQWYEYELTLENPFWSLHYLLSENILHPQLCGHIAPNTWQQLPQSSGRSRRIPHITKVVKHPYFPTRPGLCNDSRTHQAVGDNDG